QLVPAHRFILRGRLVGYNDVSRVGERTNRSKLGCFGERLAERDESILGSLALGGRAQLVTQLPVAEVERQAWPSGMLKNELDLVPPEPDRAVQESCCDKRRDRAVELGEQGAGDARLFGVAVVDGERHRVRGRGSCSQVRAQSVQ